MTNATQARIIAGEGKRMRTYKYGAKVATRGAEVVDEQIRLAHRYRNRLVEIELARRAAVHRAYRQHPEFAEAEDAALAASERLAASTNGDTKARRQEARDAWARLKVVRAGLMAEMAGVFASTQEEARDAARRARGDCKVYWGTYLIIEDAAQRANQADAPPRFKRYDGSGTVAVQVQHGMPVEKLVGGTDTRVRLAGAGKRRELHLRVGSDEHRQPVWAVFPIVWHRDLPTDASIKWVRVSRRRVGTKQQYSAQFSIETALPKLPAPTRGTVAVDVGWRKFDGGVRVAAWVDDEGRAGELRIPRRILDRYRRTESLRSIRDRSFNATLKLLLEARDDVWPAWIREELRYAHQWRATGRLARLAILWRRQRFEGDETIYGIVEAWRRQDKHLLEWEANQRENVLRARRELYRLFALEIARYRSIAVERLDLRDFAELPDEGEVEDPRATSARGRRFQAALSELLGCMADAAARAGCAWAEQKAAWTTQTCFACGAREEFDAAGPVDHTCAQCDATWDQDVNAANNLLRAVQRGETLGGRSRVKVPVPAGESAVAVRRREGKQRKAKKRSKIVA